MISVKKIKKYLIRLYFANSMALSGLRTNILRTSLTVLSITIGVSSVISLMGIGEGARMSVVEQFKSLGENVLIIKSNSSSYDFDSEEHEEIIKRVDTIDYATPVTESEKDIKWRRTSGSLKVLGVNEDYPFIKDHRIISGKFFSSLHISQRSQVCILGYDVAYSLMNGRSPVGQTIIISEKAFNIIGVLDKKGENKGDNIDKKIVVPYTTAMKIDKIRKVKEIWVKAADRQKTELAAVQLGRIFGKKINNSFTENNDSQNTEENKFEKNIFSGMQSGEIEDRQSGDNILEEKQDAVTITSLNQMVKEASNANRVMTLLLGGMAAVSLLVGGIGIMNIMLVAVSERTSEIGLRRALGSKKSDLLLQFLTETFYMSIMGCFLGVVLGAWLLEIFGKYGFETVLSFQAVKTAVFIALMSGIIFGVYPAYTGSQLSPVEALRRQ